MSMEAIRQLNSGGLKLKTNFTAKSVAANISANRSAIASKYSIFGSNRMFTPANRMGGTPKYASSSMISRGINRQSMSYVGGDIPVSSASYSQNVTMGTSSAFNAGNAIGMILGAAPSILGALNKMGLFGGDKGATNVSASAALNSASQISNTAISLSGSGDVQGAISNMELASTQDSAALRGAISEAKAEFSAMNATKGELQQSATSAQENLGKAKTDFQKAGENVSSAKGKVDVADREKNTAVKNRDDAISNFAKAKGAKNEAQTGYYKAVGNKTAAENDVNVATTKHDAAKAEVVDAQKGLDQANSMPESTPQEKAAKQAAIATATAKLNAAKAKEEAAKAALDQANAALNKAKDALDAADKKLSEADKKEINAENAKTEAEKALNETNKAVEEANNKLTDAKSDVKIAEQKEKDAKEYFDKLNGAAGKLSAHLEDMETLNNQISKYEEKLSDLEKSESEKLKKNKAKNDAIDKKHTKKDGKNWKTDTNTRKSERKDLATISGNNEENIRLSSLSDQSFAAHENGRGHKPNPATGNEVYYDNGVMISKEDYELKYPNG